MRKTIKSAVSVVLSAAIALTMGGVGTLTNNTSASAEDAKPSFTAAVWSYGTFAGWAEAASDTVDVTDYGEYTLTADVTENLDDLFTSDNGSTVVLGKYADLEKAGMGTTFEVVGKSIQINDGDAISWNVSPVNWDDDARLVIQNGWNADLDFKTDVVAPVKAGDKIKVTFEVKTKSDDASGDDSADSTPAPETPAGPPAAEDLIGTAKLAAQANNWANSEDCTNVNADINGAGTYTVSSTWEETQDDPQNYCAVRIEELDKVAGYITFSDVTIWVDGKVVDMPVAYGGDGDCRIQLWNVWGIKDDGSTTGGYEIPENFPESFYEIKVQFTIGVRDTERDFKAEGADSSLINIDTTQPDYEPDYKPSEIIVPVPSTPPASDSTDTKNAVTALKAAKKTVSVKKGKKTDVTVKVTATDSKKKTTDKVTVVSSNKKVAKVVKTSVKAGKIVVSVKGVKKGTAKITVKAAKKKAVVTVKVK